MRQHASCPARHKWLKAPLLPVMNGGACDATGWIVGMRYDWKRISLRKAQEFVRRHHRHHPPPRVHSFSLGLFLDNVLIAVLIAAPPIARARRWTDDRGLLPLHAGAPERRLTTTGPFRTYRPRFQLLQPDDLHPRGRGGCQLASVWLASRRGHERAPLGKHEPTAQAGTVARRPQTALGAGPPRACAKPSSPGACSATIILAGGEDHREGVARPEV
jgi:hypothetical protein